MKGHGRLVCFALLAMALLEVQPKEKGAIVKVEVGPRRAHTALASRSLDSWW